MRRREFLTGAAALATYAELERQAAAMGIGKEGAQFGHLGTLLGGAGKGIQLSASTFPAGAAQGTAIGTLSVIGGTGTYTFTLTDSHTNAVQVAGANGASLQVGLSVSSVGSFNIGVHADNGAGSTFDHTFLITATSSQSEPFPVIF